MAKVVLRDRIEKSSTAFYGFSGPVLAGKTFPRDFHPIKPATDGFNIGCELELFALS
jgi:hypothetical protein